MQEGSRVVNHPEAIIAVGLFIRTIGSNARIPEQVEGSAAQFDLWPLCGCQKETSPSQMKWKQDPERESVRGLWASAKGFNVYYC